MNSTSAGDCYCVRVSGHLDDHWAEWLGDWSISRSADGTTTLVGHVADQAQLHGILAHVRDLGAVLLDVALTPKPDLSCEMPPSGLRQGVLPGSS